MRRQLVEEGVVERLAQRDALLRLVLQHARDQVEQLPVLLRRALQVPLWGETASVKGYTCTI